jgi:hypothetical protein
MEARPVEQGDESRLQVEACEHEAPGFVTCTARGVIVWRGPLDKFAVSAAAEIHTIYCHDADLPKVQKIVAKSGQPRK